MGKAKNLKKRVSSYFLKTLGLGAKTSILVSQIAKIKTIITNSEIEAFLLESKYIKKYRPKYNIKLADDKAYPMIKITLNDKYPKVLVARRPDDKSSIYFGPFPNGALALRTVLKMIRRIFPYVSAPNHAKRICLYYHLGLCPCPPVFDTSSFKKEYNKNIRHIIDFLNGNTKKILKDLKKERDILSKIEEFEKANLLQSKINAIKLITGPFYQKGLDLNLNPNLTEDLRENEMRDLINILNKNNVPVKNLARIECYDISNISGTNATGSLVVFTNGEKNGDLYRRFKIKTLNTQNDFGMMDEVLQRRMKHSEWPYPNLIIVDGGKGQVSTVIKVLKDLSLNILVIGLAKREETIVTTDFKEIVLSKNSDALKLIMRVRDEAHRFAITYHRHLRSKALLT
ncbi:MAG: UvrABC system protein [Candidatus Levybacteria bacterium]|nr:UvrABC system protein [Candidatus Levybacteria bacterium]